MMGHETRHMVTCHNGLRGLARAPVALGACATPIQLFALQTTTVLCFRTFMAIYGPPL